VCFCSPKCFVEAGALGGMGLVECCAGIWLPHVAPEGLSGVHALHLGYGSLGVQYPRGIMGNPWKSRFLGGNFWEICMDWHGFGILMYYVDYQSGRDFVWICWVTSKHRHSLDLFMAGAPQLAKCWGSMQLETAEPTAIPSLCCHLGLKGHIPVVFTLGTMVEGDWDISRSDLEGS
jgi:hypothetical protein